MSYNCVLCQSNNLVFKMYPRDSNEKKIYECQNCKLVQIHPRIEIIREIKENGELDYQDSNRITTSTDLDFNQDKEYTFNNNVSDQDKEMNDKKIIHVIESDRYRYLKHFQKVLDKYNFKKEGLNILDVGCGYGYWCHTINENYNHNVTGMDLNLNKVLYGKKTLNLDFKYIIEKIEDEDFIKKNEGNFDIITNWHVIEHVYDPILFISNIMRLLKDNGIFLFELPNEDDELINLVPEYSKIVHFQDHVNYFNPKTIDLLFEKCNIKKENYNIEGCQRYGFYNYIDWIRFGVKNKVLSDDYINLNINPEPRSQIEKLWIEYREKNLNSDTMVGIIQKK
jgi:2-polyprenyl-3-methyl-5-hydroxy-6-metoxy-1,4-benzoquinol methylase